jgi:Family of unknown function (DUF6483)
MYRDDYILRMIRRFGQIIAHLVGLQKQGQYPLALMAADDAMRNTLGVGSDAVAERSDREILALIRFADPDGSWREIAAYVAAILHAEAAIYQAQGDHELVPPRALLALQLLLEAELAEQPETPIAALEYAPSRDHLLELLHGYTLPSHTRAALFQRLEHEGRYGQAEDTLFDLLADAPADGGLLAGGIAFYERILALDDDALADGGLPRPEAAAALAELQGRDRTRL